MEISVELTLMPLQNDFREPIINFIKRLRASEFTVVENALSTQVFGEYDAVMEFLKTELKQSFESTQAIIANMKIVKTNRSNYEPHF